MFVRLHIPRSVSPLAERSSWFRAKNSHLRDDTKDVNEQSLNPLMPALELHSNGLLYSSVVISTLATDVM